MAKQVLEIEIPDGKKATWKDGRIVFEDVGTIENIKTVGDAAQFLADEGICEDILDSLSRLHEDSFEWKVAAYRAVVAAMTNNEQEPCITGEYWYPTIELCEPSNFKKCYGSNIVGQIKSNGKVFDVVSGFALDGSLANCGRFHSFAGVSYAWTGVWCGYINTKKAASYISEHFGKLLFEISFGGSNCNWEWVK